MSAEACARMLEHRGVLLRKGGCDGQSVRSRLQSRAKIVLAGIVGGEAIPKDRRLGRIASCGGIAEERAG